MIPLSLPKPSAAEGIADPKTVLKEALLMASEASGRRRQDMAKKFGMHRSLLLERLDPGGDVSKLAAWRRMVENLEAALAALDSGDPKVS